MSNNWIMDTWTYYARRLTPFLLVYLVYEAAEVAALAWLHDSEEPGSLRDVVCLAEGTLASFCFCVLPNVLSQIGNMLVIRMRMG